MSTAFTSIERMADPIGFDIGNSNSKVQADLLNGVARALWGGADRREVEMQNAYITDDLTAQAKQWITNLAAMIGAPE